MERHLLDNYDFIVYTMNEKQKEYPIKNRLFIATEPFRKCWKAMGLDDDNLKELETVLLQDPQCGDVIQGTGGARKIRIQLNDNKGKSGGGRVIDVDIFEKERIYLLFAYPKNVQENLTPEQKKAISQVIEAIKKE